MCHEIVNEEVPKPWQINCPYCAQPKKIILITVGWGEAGIMVCKNEACAGKNKNEQKETELCSHCKSPLKPVTQICFSFPSLKCTNPDCPTKKRTSPWGVS